MRTIRLKLFTQTAVEALQTAARTFGELKKEIQDNPSLSEKINFSNVQFIERDTKVIYGAIDDAILPSVDCIMFVTPTKTKLGALPTVSELEDMSYNELRSLGSRWNKEDSAGLDISGKRADILIELITYVSVMNESVKDTEVTPLVLTALDKVKTIEKYASELTKEIEGLISMAKQPKEEPSVVKVTIEMLDKEAKALAQLFKK